MNFEGTLAFLWKKTVFVKVLSRAKRCAKAYRNRRTDQIKKSVDTKKFAITSISMHVKVI